MIPPQQQTIIILATDDTRLRSKAERLFAGQSVNVLRFLATQNEILPALSPEPTSDSQMVQEYIFIDLDAKEFDAYELARDIKEAAPHIHIIASSLSIEPAVIQKTKLFRIDRVLQRFKFEELLKNIATSAGEGEVIKASRDNSTA
jgi:DNA-binding NarL/FixJ family response regulator